MDDLTTRVNETGARELKREEKRKKELRHYYRASRFMRYVESVVGWFCSDDKKYRQGR